MLFVVHSTFHTAAHSHVHVHIYIRVDSVYLHISCVVSLQLLAHVVGKNI